jgi:hypothetical protein
MFGITNCKFVKGSYHGFILRCPEILSGRKITRSFSQVRWRPEQPKSETLSLGSEPLPLHVSKRTQDPAWKHDDY